MGGDRAVPVVRVSDTQWQAVEDGVVAGTGDASLRPDGRLFVSIDAWHRAAFDRIAEAVLADLPAPLHTLVDENDHEEAAAWARLGFTTERREWGHLVPTDPRTTGAVPCPEGVTIVPAGSAEEGPLRELDRIVRAEVESTVGWRRMPAEVLPRPTGDTVVDPSKYAVAQEGDRYVGLVRVVPFLRQPRIGLIAVRADRQRHGIARALLGHALGALHASGRTTAWAEVDESNTAATALLAGFGARRTCSTLELVRR
nr:GNAT family N-acetyltransferase [Streptomyces sp. NRRL B-24484]